MNPMIERMRDRRGVALPLALVGLVAVSLLVTTALLTSSTESAISAAQTNSTRSLYDAESGLQLYLRQNIAAAAAGLQPGVTEITVDSASGRRVQLTTAVLQSRVNAAGDSVMRTVSVLAEPLRAGRPLGRAVIAMVRQAGLFTNMSLNVNEGAVVGSDLEVGGHSKVIDNSTICSDTVGAGAVKHADGTTVRETGSGDIQGEVNKSANQGQAFVEEILGAGKTLRDFAELGEIQFGDMFDQADFPTNAKAEWDADDTRMRWGCPTRMGFSCPSGADTTYYPIIAIDAGGGAIDLQGDHGQGILIVVNGSLKITGNFLFKGLLLIEGYIDMSGTGGQTGSKIEGSVIAFGEGTNERSRVDESSSSGNAVISYNRCAVNEAQQSFNRRSREFPRYQAPSSTFAWYEVVR
jgi:hypothetical protein